MLLVILKSKKLQERFAKKNCKKQIKKDFRVEKVIKRNGNKLYVKWKDCDNYFDGQTDKKDIVQVSGYFSEPQFFRGNAEVPLDLSNYATKLDLKNATGVNT